VLPIAEGTPAFIKSYASFAELHAFIKTSSIFEGLSKSSSSNIFFI